MIDRFVKRLHEKNAKKLILATCMFICVAAFSIMSRDNAGAVSRSHCRRTNPAPSVESTNNACNLFTTSDGFRGALWVNGSRDNLDEGEVIIMPEDVEDGKSTVYLHGMVYANESSSSTKYWAYRIWIGEAGKMKKTDPKVDYIWFDTDKLYRGHGSSSGGWSKGSEPMKGKIDLEKFKDGATVIVDAEGNNKYVRTVSVNRCSKDIKYNNTSGRRSGKCYGDDIRIILRDMGEDLGEYSYSNTPSFNITNDTAPAGETVTIRDAQVVVTKRPDAPEDGVAGIAENIDIRLISYIHEYAEDTRGTQLIPGPAELDLCGIMGGSAKLCHVAASTNNTLNSSGFEAGSTDMISSFNSTYNVPDANAGDYMCFVMAIHSAASASAISLRQAPDGDNNWQITAPKCIPIAKRPSFWVTGGGFYTSGSVLTAAAKKRNIYGFYPYHTKGEENTTVFGSMTEYSSIALGTAKSLASGAAVGYTNTPGRPATGSFEGDRENFCKNRAPLSMANYSTAAMAVALCPNLSAESTGMLSIGAKNINKEQLVSYWADGAENIPGGTTVNLNNPAQYDTIKNAAGITARHTRAGNGGLHLSSATIPTGVTHVVRSSGTIFIDGNIEYANASIVSLREIPKVIIYAQNIAIGCNVDRINAILVAENNITTCSESNLNSSANSRQLYIGGTIVADSLTLTRTYGAAAGNNSGVPAEIINYDPSIIPWARYMSGTDTSGAATVVYQSELAPRY